MPFNPAFTCLWCGARHTVRGPDDVEGWARLCPDCVGRAGDNGFLSFRLRQALIDRGAAARAAPAPAPPVPVPALANYAPLTAAPASAHGSNGHASMETVGAPV